MRTFSVVLFAVILVVLCSSADIALGQQQQQTTQQLGNDVAALNYALTLEHLEAAFYTEGLALYNDSDFINAGLSSEVRSYINLIRAHEVAHVNLLTSVINSYGYAAVRPCVYNFNGSLSSIRLFLSTARLLEATGTAAYDGAANTINDANLLQAAATIATIEARHTAYLNELTNQNPFPVDIGPARTPDMTIQATADLFIRCPDTYIRPEFAYKFVPLSYNRTYLNQSGQLETSEQVENDNDVLNYSLTLELFGVAFYSAAANFTDQDFTNAGYGSAYSFFQLIIQHEYSHAEFLTQVLQSRGATVARPCSYNFGNNLDSVENALLFAKALANLGVNAYDGAINRLTQYDLIQAAASIATVEARHAQYLTRLLFNISVNQEAFDLAFDPAQVLNITAPYFGADCTTPVIPVKAYTLQEFGTTAYVQPSPVPTASSVPTASPSSRPTTTLRPPTPTPTPTTSPGGNGNYNGNEAVIINFFFADVLRGL